MKHRFGLYLILTRPVAGYEACARAAVEAGVHYLQLRMKNAPRPEIIEAARTIRALTRNTRTRFIINDDLTVAMEVDADGLHLGQDDLPLAEARKRWNTPGKILGLSTHSARQARQALESAPDYIGVGPVFPTPTKPDAEPALGLLQAAQIIRQSPIPAFAIGGIHTGNLPQLLEEGIENFCVVRAVNEAVDPAVALRALRQIRQDSGF